MQFKKRISRLTSERCEKKKCDMLVAQAASNSTGDASPANKAEFANVFNAYRAPRILLLKFLLIAI